MNRLGWLLLAGTGLTLLAFLGILVWASLQTRGTPGGMGINTDFGVVEIDAAPARDFTLELLDGDTLTLSDLRGKVVMVDFWASWCTPCRQEAPVLEQVYQEYDRAEVEFIGVNIWDLEDNAPQYVADFGLTYPSGVDAPGAIAIDYGVRGIPEKFFIGRDGVVRQKFVGPMRPGPLRETLDNLLAEGR